jgi:hypothetical protein
MMRRDLGFVSMVAILGVGALGCGEIPDGEDVTSVQSALSVGQLPQGFTCGLGYVRNYNDNPVLAYCNDALTIWAYTTSPPLTYHVQQQTYQGFSNISDGDRGLGNGWGYYHQRLISSSSGVSAANADYLVLPPGTACGFKETCNSGGETCLGKDPNSTTDPCPIGWTKRTANDASAPSGCNFAWCEYQDPHSLCSSGTCPVSDQQTGIVCGITDSDKAPGSGGGYCMGLSTQTACPAGWGWQRHGNYDAGRSGGHGLAWCSKG